MAENRLPLDPERRKEKEFFEELYPREEPETTRSSMTPRGNRKPIGSGGAEKERQYKRRSKKRRFPKILETRAMQDIYDRDTNIHEGRDKVIEESKGLEGQEKIDKLKEAARTKLRGQEFMDDLISKIEGGFQTVVDTAATDDPDSYLDDAARTGLTTLQFIGNVANTPGISHTLRFLDTPFWVARQAAGGALEHGLGVDPRYGHAAVGVGEFFAGGKALTKVGKGLKHLDKALDAKDIARRYAVQMNLFNYIDSTSDVPVPRNLTFGEMLSTKNIIKSQSAELLKEATNPNLSAVKKMEFYDAAKKGGYSGQGWLRYKEFRKKAGKMSDEGRDYGLIFESPQTAAGIDRAVNLKKYKETILPKLRETFGPTLEALNIKGGAQVHHIAAVKAITGIFNDTQYMSPLYKEVTKVLLEELPGLGNMKSNLLGVIGGSKDVRTPHGIVHKFYKETIGESGEKFFTDEVLKGMNASKEFRLRKARELAGIIKKSENIVVQAQKTFEDLYDPNIRFDELVERLSKFNDKGFIDTIGPEYQIPQMKEIIDSILFQKAIEPQIPALKQVNNPKALEALAIAVEDGISAVKALKQAKYGKQLELAIDQITPENLPLLQKARRGKSIKLDEQTGMRPDD